MVLVNSLGTQTSYPIFEHAQWDGCSLADLVFPSFLFIVGITSAISLQKYKLEEKSTKVYRIIFKRAALLFILGIIINAFPSHFNLEHLRFYGILQRIALCYLFCAIFFLNTSIKTQAIIFFIILIGYWYLLTQVPLPGLNRILLNMDQNWVEYIDKKIFLTTHFYGKTDPEGLLSTLPSIATTLSGLMTGGFLLGEFDKTKKISIMLGVGTLFLLSGWLWSYSFPINKTLWTSTFILWTTGFSLIAFTLCYFLIDAKGYTKWSLPFKICGMNALFIFILHVVLLKIQASYHLILSDGTRSTLRVVLDEYFCGYFNPQNAGLFYALVFLFLNFLVAFYLYWKKIFIKI